ncbi:PEP-CTERM sorting domain-containing protein [Candidatus Nitrospira bockiana]
MLRQVPRQSLLVLVLSVLWLALSLGQAAALTVDPFYAGVYTATSLGSVPGLPTNYGGLTLKSGDPNTLLIGGAANTANGKLYSIGVTRDGSGHINGFSGSASVYADAAYNDGGVVYGPGEVLFLARWPVNELGQTIPGSVVTDKIIDLDPLGVTPSPGGLAFVPPGMPGAGQLKLVSWAGGQWYTLDYAPDGTGTFDITSATLNVTIVGGPEGIFYVPLGSALFGNPSVLVSEYSAGKVGAYEVDGNGNPITATRRDFITGLTGAEGAAIDPLTGDFLFSTFGGGNQVVVVKGFTAPPPPPPSGVPEPASLLLLGSGVAALAISRRFLKS